MEPDLVTKINTGAFGSLLVYYLLINLDCSLFIFSPDFQSNSNKKSLLNDYDTGIGSTTTLLSSPQPVCRSQVKTNGHFTTYMQVM